MKKQLLQITALLIIELMLFLPISFALEINGVQITDVTASSAKVSWYTDEYATGMVNYGETEELDYRQRHTNWLHEHSLYLYGLNDETEYYVAVESTDPGDVTVVDNNSNNFYTFTTDDITPPEQVNGLVAESSDIDYVYLRWDSADASDLSHYFVYRDRIKIANTTETGFNDTGLMSDWSYLYKVSAVDTSGNEGALSNTYVAKTLMADITPPGVAHVDADKITDTTAEIRWITDENSTSVVYYGLNQAFNKIAEVEGLTLNHSVTVTQLLKGNNYIYKVSSCDSRNNCVNSTANEFEAGADRTPPVIDTTLPNFYNKKRIDIIGSVEPYSRLRLYVNDMLLAVRALDRDETSEGTFEFYNIELDNSNVIKIWAQDKAGNVNSESYNVVVDMKDPIVSLGDILRIHSKKNFTISGSVNEQVTMNVYLKGGEETEPSRITGLKANAGNNSVELSWDKSGDKDFNHYVVYRDDIGAIAITEPSSYNSYEDILVNDGQSYTYRVSAVNRFGRQGPRSDPATALISGGKTGLPKPEEIADVIGQSLKATLSMNVSGSFSTSIRLKEDGQYSLKIEFIDRALNTVLIEKGIYLDTKEPEIKITNPKKGTFIYENYANEVDIGGETEPYAKVHLYIERTPLGLLDRSFDVSGLPDQIDSIPEDDLKADCRLRVGGTSFCSTGADYSTTADDEGNFIFEDVDLTSWIGVGATITEVPATEFSRSRELKEARKARLVFIATDRSGLRGAEGIDYRIGTCWAGNFSWELMPLVEWQSPSILSMERLRENNEHIYFYFNYTYLGRGESGRIKTVTLSKACSGAELLGDSRFNLSCQILPPGAEGQVLTQVNPEGKITYTTLKLERLPDMEKWLKGDWESFFESVSNEMTFPFKVIITYEHDVDGRTVRETQTTCQEVTYVLDNSLVDFRHALPDWLLYDFVNFLDDSITTINKVQNELKKVIDYVAVGCVASYMLRLGWQVYRRWISFFEEKKVQAKKFIDIDFDLQSDEDKKYCENAAKAIEVKFGSRKLKYFSNADLKRCFKGVAAAWEKEEELYTYYRYTCDRMFGHKTPSKWTEQAIDDTLSNKLKSGEGCAVDQGAKGKPLSVVKCRDIAKDFLINKELFSLDDKCFVVKEGKEESLYTLSDVENRENKIYKIKHSGTGRAKLSSDYAIKQTENSYLTAQDKYCSEVCGITEPEKQDSLSGKAQDSIWKWGENERNENVDSEYKPEGKWACMPAQECRALKGKPPKKDQPKVENSYTRGFTKDCFYNSDVGGVSQTLKSKLRDAKSISDDPNERYECCCINAVKSKDEGYYSYDDKVRYTVLDLNEQLYAGQPAYAFESKTNKDQQPQGGDEGEQWKDMQWSYRYWKEKFETSDGGTTHYEYNPNRYMEGRDKPACFGQNSWIYDFDAKAGEGNLLIIDPAKQHVSAFQCLHIPGIYNRLQLLKNMMSSLSSCLVTVRTTGRGDTGVCKELFTQYVCSAIWRIIQFTQDGCLPFGHGFDFSGSDNEIVQYVSAGFDSVWGSVADSQQELNEEYGNAKLNNLLGAGEGAIARKICLGAFGYDWELNLDDVIDVAYASPYATLVQKMTGSREFLTVDPNTNKAKYEYRASWLINPGCDMQNYRVELSCVSRNEMDKYGVQAGGLGGYAEGFGGINCEKVQDPGGQNCDCLNLGEERKELFYSSNAKLPQGNLEDRDHHKIIESDYRYDHLKFTLRTDARIPSDLKDSCFPDLHEDGVFYFPIRDRTLQDVTACQADLSQGMFRCTPAVDFWTEQGRAQFIGVEINGERATRDGITLYRGDPLEIEPTIRKLTGKPVCLIIEVDKQGVKEKQFDLIDIEGRQSYPYKIEDSIQPVRTGTLSAGLTDCELTDAQKNEGSNIGKNCIDVVRTRSLRYKIISTSGSTEKIGPVKFEDKWKSRTGKDEPDGEITINTDSKDEMTFKGDTRQIRQWLAEKRSDDLILEDGGVQIKIEYAGFDDKIKSIEYDDIEVIGAAEGQEQRWTITLSLNHVRDENNDCSRPGDIIEYQGRTQLERYNVNIAGEAAALGPTVKIDVDDIIPTDDNLPIEIKATISSNREITRVNYELRTPNGNQERRNIDLEDCVDSSASKKDCTIQLGRGDLLEFAGNYYITVEARDEARNEGEKTEYFSVKCYEGDVWGECKPDTEQCGLDEINDTDFACAQDHKCCRVGDI